MSRIFALRNWRAVTHIAAVAALSLNILATGLPALITQYREQQARTPQALAETTTVAPAAADAVLPEGRAAALPAAIQEQLDADRQKAKAGAPRDLRHIKTLNENRTEHDRTFLNADGSKTLEHSEQATSYQDAAGAWHDVDVSLEQDKSGTWQTKANSWRASFGGLQDGVKVTAGAQTVTIKPAGEANVTPEITGSAPHQIITYRNVWPGINLQYIVTGSELKETIVVKSRVAPTTYAFDIVGAGLKANPDRPGSFKLDGALSGFVLSAPSVGTFNQGIIGSDQVKQVREGNRLTVTLDAKWLAAQPFEAFPVVVDPTLTRYSSEGPRYRNFKSDGYICDPGMGCGNSTGNASNQNWRFAYGLNAPQIAGTWIVQATLHLEMPNPDGVHYYGVYDPRWIVTKRATCYTSWLCNDSAYGESWQAIGASGDADVTTLYRNAVNNNNADAWMMVQGDETPNFESYKLFAHNETRVSFTYDALPSASTVVAPADGGITVSTQPTLKSRVSADIDGPGPTKYRYIVGTGKNGAGNGNTTNPGVAVTGIVADSGDTVTPSYTVPDNVLQDGTTYYWQVAAWDNWGGVPASLTPVYSFRVDLRNGKDATQAFDTAGPVNVDLATGNVTTSAKSHSISALGGSLGVSLDYNSPQRSRQGLVAQYWNNTSFSGNPAVTRVEPNIDYNWSTSSPYAGMVVNDNFSARWSGYFVAPSTGTFTLGCVGDDVVKATLNNQVVLDTTNGGCYDAPHWGTGVALTVGQIVPITVDYIESTGSAYTALWVRGSGLPDQVVPSEWLQTGVRPVTTPHGLIGRYYTGTAFPASESDTTSRFLARTDTNLGPNWGTGSPVPNGPADNFVVRWSGYFKAPQTGSYMFGGRADDGIKIMVNGVVQVDTWSSGSTSNTVWAGSGIPLSAGQTIPLTVEYKELTGGASLGLYVDGPGLDPATVVPADWLLPQAQVLPDGWSLGIDADGNLGYDFATIGAASVVLRSSTGATHEYKWTGSGYTPPINEAGHLVRNGDGTITLQDSDGRTYVFNTDGTLKSSTNPVDDRSPAALQYSYAGLPARLTQITDGVNTGRWAKLFYSGDAGCPAVPGGFAAVPAGMICAVTTSDNQTTQFAYSAEGRLARIIHPGAELSDYGYNTLGLLTSMRDGLANDAITAGVRSQDGTELTTLTYDELGRASTVTLPAATAGATRQGRSYGYQPQLTTSTALSRYYYPGNGDHMAIITTPPSGYGWEATYGHLLNAQAAGTHALYSCAIGADEFTSTNSGCEGQTVRGLLGYAYDTAPAGLASRALYRCNTGGDHFDSTMSNCETFTVEGIMGYLLEAPAITAAATKVHVAGAAEPNGFTRRVTYDSAYRTTADTDAANLTTTTEWDVDAAGTPHKDLVLATTDPTGLKSTTIYDDADRPTDQYGPAPSAWYGADRRPTSSYVNQAPHTQTGYDETITGPAVAYYHVAETVSGTGTATKLLAGAPQLHATGLNTGSPGTMDKTWSSNPIGTGAGMVGWGFAATGELRLPAGSYSFIINHTEGARLWLNDQLIISDWSDGAIRNSAEGPLTVTASQSPVRLRLEHYSKYGTSSPTLRLYVKQNSGFDWTTNFAPYLKPGYGLATTQTTYDSSTAVGNATSTTNYGTNPELGLAQSSTLDAAGLNYTSSSVYETQGAAGSYLRQTAKYLPGATAGTLSTATQYAHYTATATADNPCTSGATEAYKQAGMLRLKTEPDPDGAGAQTSRTTETIYDDAGRIVATRYNTESWTCTTYDSRGRVTQVSVPAFNGAPARTVTNTWAVSGNPLVTSSSDASGTITTTVDLLGRTTSYTDVRGNTTTTSYDSLGRLSSRSGPLGLEEFTYDNLNRLTAQKLDSVIQAVLSHDAFGRMSGVTYPTAGSLALTVTRDSLGRTTGHDYTLGNGTTHLTDAVVRSQSGQIISGTELGQSKSYSYDKAGRLTVATIGTNTYGYSFAAPTGCTGAANAAANKNSNRTSQTVNGVTTTYCYDAADRLISSSDATVTAPTYDSHGNTKVIGSGATPLRLNYDSSDRNTGLEQYGSSGNGIATYLDRDVQGRITHRHTYNVVNWSWNWTGEFFYGFTGAGDTPDLLLTSTNTVVEKYEQLPGGVLLTIRPGATPAANQRVFSLPNIHGDIMATTDASGAQTGTFQYDPFGNKVSATLPNNTATGSTYGWVGQHEKDTETAFTLAPTEMGARVYLAKLGRFLQVDPEEGGNENNYVYPPDPVNDFDLDGNAGFWDRMKKAVKVVTVVASVASMIPGPIGMVASAVAVAGNLAQGNYAGAAAAAVGFIPGGKLVGALASRSAGGAKLLTKVMNYQARMPGIGAQSKLFGVRGILNKGKYRIGWSGGDKIGGSTRLNFRIGTPGSHNAFLGYRFNTGYKWQNVKKGIFR